MINNWPDAVSLSTAILVFGTGTFAFLFKMFFGDKEKKNTENEKINEKIKTKIFVEIAELKANQNNLKETLNRFKDDVQRDFQETDSKIEESFKELRKLIVNGRF